jgi:DNA-nicking Smr family endonuclease
MIAFESQVDLHEYGKISFAQLEFRIDQFLELSYQEKLSPILIITGKGRGILKTNTLKILKNHKRIDKLQTPCWGQGDEGAIAVWLRDC